MVEFFLEKNTTKFENPLAHIKNTLRAHQMCAHITLGSPELNFEAKITLNFQFKFLLYEQLFFLICCYEMKCPKVLKKIYHNFFSSHGVLIIVTQQSIKNRVETPSTNVCDAIYCQVAGMFPHSFQKLLHFAL